MKAKELEQNSFINEWLTGIKAKKATRETYLQGMQEFTEFTGKTPGKLITEAEQEIKEGKLLRERALKKDIPGFRATLEAAQKAPLTVKNRLTAVKSFFKYYDIQIPALPRSTENANPEQKRKEIPTKKDIQEILKLCNPLERALILVGAASGLSATDICSLKVSDFTKGLDPETGVTTISLVRKKTDYPFATFLTPEATKAVQEYISYRNREPNSNSNTRRREQLQKQRVAEKEGFLFIAQSVPNEYLVTHNEALRQLSEDGIQEIYRRLNERAQKNAPKGEFNVIRSHNLRRMFNSTLVAKKVPLINVDYMLGHRIDKVHEAYFRADMQALKEDYITYIPWLTFAEELDVTVSPEFKRVIEENDKLKAEITRVDVERTEFQELREEIKKLRKAQEDREELKKEFEPFAKEYQERVKKVEEVTGMSYDDAEGLYNVAEIAPDSKKMEEHQKRLGKDKEYRERWKGSRSNKIEKQQQEIEHKMFKTFADRL